MLLDSIVQFSLTLLIVVYCDNICSAVQAAMPAAVGARHTAAQYLKVGTPVDFVFVMSPCHSPTWGSESTRLVDDLESSQSYHYPSGLWQMVNVSWWLSRRMRGLSS